MSKVGKKIIIVPEGVKVAIEAEVLKVSGKNGELISPILSNISANLEGNELVFTAQGDDKQTLANWGTTRALAQNAIAGAENDFAKSLKIEGVGYRAVIEGSSIILTVGYSHPVKMDLPEGITASVEKNILTLKGRSKEAVGTFAAKIRAIRKPEPYKGTGIAYTDEVIRRKAGKKVVGSGAK
ncbi:MAG: 50S ribosomal protein L6 [Candidatus Colwellbacteria bacterium]|nr:50S ribosomal protein L6 [Candidatus Colwellbacteria bacterium]